MASLRKRPVPDEITVPADPGPEVTAEIDTDPAPAQAPLPDGRSAAAAGPQPDEASRHALRKQVADLRQAEAVAQAEQRTQSWLASTPLAQRNRDMLEPIHRELIADGAVIYSTPEYYQAMERELVRRESQRRQEAAASRLAEEMETRVAQDREPEPPQPRQRGPIYSAPVSREGTGYGGSSISPSRVQLTRAECELAKLSGITEAEYARQKMKLDEMKRNGDYQERR